MRVEYRKALAEVNEILASMDKTQREKVPVKLREFIKSNLDPDYPVLINSNKPVYEQNLLKDTKVLLSIMYRNYWCTKEEKEELVNKDKEERIRKEAELREKYNPDKIFSNTKEEKTSLPNEVAEVIKETTPNADLVEYKEETFITKLINKIKSIFSNLFKK